MLHEISTALDHLVTLLHPSIDCKAFKQQAQASLLTRYSTIWFPNDPNRASASRVVHWHGHGGGEGHDESIWKACNENLSSKEMMIDFFSSPFTLWIDPGCVSIRTGHGPGVYLSPASSINIKVIYGFPTVDSPMTSMLPTVNLVPSTPALSNTGNITAWSSTATSLQSKRIPQAMPPFHNRSYSACSNSSTVTTTKPASNGSSSYLSSADENEQCPSLTNTSARDSDSEISVEDLIDDGCYMNFDIDDEEEEDALYGDETIGNDNDNDEGDVTVSPTNENVLKAPLSIVNYDGGNVGVLGGGIRLGSASKHIPLKMAKSQMHKAANFPAPMWQNAFAPMYSSDPLSSFPSNSPFTMMDGNKRIRSRGRRSRGRGAGRAARRQAAALQAISASEGIEQVIAPTMPFPERLDGSDKDENIMVIVRQRAEQVSKEVARRQREEESFKAQQKLHQAQHQHQHQSQAYPQFQRQQPQTYSKSMIAPCLAATTTYQYVPVTSRVPVPYHPEFAYLH